MSRPGVTKSDVQRAKAELEAQGKSVTVASIRAHLKTGSPVTVTKLLREIRDEQREQAGDASAESPVPAEVVTKLAELSQHHAAAMYRALAEPLDAIARQRELELAAERRDMDAEVDQALAELGAAQERIREAQEQSTRDAARLAELTERLAQVERARQDDAQRHADDIRLERSQHLAELTRERDQRAETTGLLNQQIQQLQGDLERERAETQRLNTRCDELGTDTQDLRRKLAAQEQATAAAEQTHQAECNQHQRTREEMGELRNELTRERAERTREREELREDLRSASHASKTTQAELQGEIESLRTRLDTALAEAAELRGRLAALTPPPPSKKNA